MTNPQPASFRAYRKSLSLDCVFFSLYERPTALLNYYWPNIGLDDIDIYLHTGRLHKLDLQVNTKDWPCLSSTIGGWLSVRQWTVPQLSIMVIYNGSWSKLIQWIMVMLPGDNLTYKLQKKPYFLFVMKLITRSKKIYQWS